MSVEAALYVHAVATAVMTGLIWFVQVVHYPLLARVGAEAFVSYEREHVRRTTWIVAPAMLAEAATALALPFVVGTPGDRRLAGAGVALLVLVWASTAALQVPCHRRLERGFDAGVARRLVATNWIRTGCWSVRLLIALTLLGPGPTVTPESGNATHAKMIGSP